MSLKKFRRESLRDKIEAEAEAEAETGAEVKAEAVQPKGRKIKSKK